MLHVSILGKPKPKGRPRVVNGRAYTPPETRAYEAKLRMIIASECARSRWVRPEGDVAVRMALAFSSGVHGDLDNCAKAVLDAAQGIAFGNDKSVRVLHVERMWADDEHPEGVHMSVIPLDDMPRPKRPRKRKGAA